MPTQELAEAVKWGAAQLDGAQPEATPLATAPGVAALFLLHQKLAGRAKPAHVSAHPMSSAHPPHRTLRTAPPAPHPPRSTPAPSPGGSSRQPDQKLYKAVWGALKQAPLVHVAGRAQWRPLAFIAQQLPLPSKAMNLQAAEARACEWVKQLDADLAREIQAASAQVGSWSVRFASDRSHHPNKRALLEANALLIVDGVRLARRVGSLVRGFLCAHLELGMPMTKATLRQLVHGIMLLKTIEASPRDRAACSPTRTRACDPPAQASLHLHPSAPPPRPPSTRSSVGWPPPRTTRRSPSACACASCCSPPSSASRLHAGAPTQPSTLQPQHPACSPMHPGFGPMPTVPTLPPQCVPAPMCPGSTTRLSTGWRR